MLSPIEIEGAYMAFVLPDNRVLSIIPLTFGRARLCIANPRYDGTPDTTGYSDGW
jgi:hypothetical protein